MSGAAKFVDLRWGVEGTTVPVSGRFHLPLYCYTQGYQCGLLLEFIFPMSVGI